MERTNGKGKDAGTGWLMGALLVPMICFGVGGVLGWASVFFFSAEDLVCAAEYLVEIFHLLNVGAISVVFIPVLVRRLLDCVFLFLLSCSAPGVAGASFLLLLRGFLLSVSVSCVIRIFGASAWGIAGGLFLIPAFLCVPSLLLCCAGGVCVKKNAGRAGVGVPANLKYVVCGFGLCLLCACFECLLLPGVLRIILELLS